MLAALNIIKGAVSVKDLVPVLTHVAIHDGRVHGFDGRVHICAPCSELRALSFTVPLVPFLAAVEVCGENPHINHDLQANAVTVSNGAGFQATMPTGPIDAYPLREPQGKKIKVRDLLPVLRALQPFIGQDASRPWSAAIKIQESIALATNNIVLVAARYSGAPQTSGLTYCIPVYAIEEILRIGVEPTHLALTEEALVLYLPGQVWLRVTLLEDKWPDALAILKGLHDGATLVPLPDGVLAAVQQVRPFCPDPKHPVIRLEGNKVRTLDGVTSAAVGGLKGDSLGLGAFHADPLLNVLSVAYRADWKRFPRVPWTGNAAGVALEGVLLGLNL